MYFVSFRAMDDVKTPPDLPEHISQRIRKHGTIRRIVVDRAACIGARSCVLVAEKTFEMDDENLAIVKNAELDDEETIKLAAKSCPVLAILLYDKDGNKIFPSGGNAYPFPANV